MTTPSALSSTMTDVQPSRSRAHFTFDIVLPPFRAFRARFVPISPTPPRVFLSQSVLTPHPSSAAEQQHELLFDRTYTFCRTSDHPSWVYPYSVWTHVQACCSLQSFYAEFCSLSLHLLSKKTVQSKSKADAMRLATDTLGLLTPSSICV